MRYQWNELRSRFKRAAQVLGYFFIPAMVLVSIAEGQAARIPHWVDGQSSWFDSQPEVWSQSYGGKNGGTKYLLFSDGTHGVLLLGPVFSKQPIPFAAFPAKNEDQDVSPRSNDTVNEMVRDLEKIRANRGSVVSDVFRDIAPNESSDAVFREELIQIATDAQQAEQQAKHHAAQQEARPYPSAYPFENRPLPLRVYQPGTYVGLDQFEPALRQPLQSNHSQMPVADHFSDQSHAHFGAPLPSHNAVSLRRIARTLDEAAADLEEIGRFEEADRIRHEAQGLRVSGRGSHR